MNKRFYHKAKKKFNKEVLDNIVLDKEEMRQVFINWLKPIPFIKASSCAIRFEEFWKVISKSNVIKIKEDK